MAASDGRRLRVGVIGAGAGGLVVCRHFAEDDRFVVTAFERSGVVGGTWNYTERTGLDDDGLPVHSSLYRDLRTNLPKEAMGFPDFRFPDYDDGGSFVSHPTVLRYLRDYARHFDLLRHVRFHSLVRGVSPVPVGDPVTWEMRVRDVRSGATETLPFDAIAVCNGHYSVPTFPDVEGMESFEGTLLHSHDYRVPEAFVGRTVAVLGAGPSGLDIALEVAAFARQVVLCLGSVERISSPLPTNLRQATWPTRFDARGLLMDDGDRVAADAVIACTGYEYAFPFLSPECGVTVVDRRVVPLYAHLLHARHPSLALFGVPSGVLPLPLMDLQARAFRNVLLGVARLPPEAERVAESERELEAWVAGGGAPRRFHRMGCDRFRRHAADLARMARLEPLPEHVHRLHRWTWEARARDLSRYRLTDYGVRPDGEAFVRVEAPDEGDPR